MKRETRSTAGAPAFEAAAPPATEPGSRAVPSAQDVLSLAGPFGPMDDPCAGDDRRFCQLTGAANRAFAGDDAGSASRLYREALEEAERLFEAARTGGSPLVAPMAYTIACHNVAEAARRDGDHAAAHGHKRHAVAKLLDTAESRRDPLALRVNCLRHLRHGLAFLAEDLGDADAERRAEFDGVVLRYRAIGDELARVASHVVAERARDATDTDPPAGRGRLN